MQISLDTLSQDLSTMLGTQLKCLMYDSMNDIGAINRHFLVEARANNGQIQKLVLRLTGEPAYPKAHINPLATQAQRAQKAVKLGIRTPIAFGCLACADQTALVMDWYDFQADPKMLAQNSVDDQRRFIVMALQQLALLHENPSQTSLAVTPDDPTCWIDRYLPDCSKDFSALITAVKDLNLPEGSSGLHGDFRYGNLGQSINGPVVLDWDFARAGHPLEDLAWLSLPPWRYSAKQAVALDSIWLLECYEEIRGLTFSETQLKAFQVKALYQWIFIASMQVARSEKPAKELFADAPQQMPDLCLRQAFDLLDQL